MEEDIKKTIELLKNISQYYSDYNLNISDSEKIDIAIETSEKQIAKKIENKGSIFMMGSCPTCDETVNYPKKYCYWCGQKLDWE